MASLALNHGVPEFTVQRMGNWKTRTMVARYAHLADEELRKAAARVADLVGGRKGGRKVSKSSGPKHGTGGGGCVDLAEETLMYLPRSRTASPRTASA